MYCTDFYSGVLTALKAVKKTGIKTHIDTYDNNDSFNEGGIIRINFRTINKSKENKTERVFLDGDNNMYFNEYPMQDLDGWNYYIRN